MNFAKTSARLAGRWPVAGLIGSVLLLTLSLYGSSLHFSFIWDDPFWYNHIAGKTGWQALLPIPEFQFYRPLAMGYSWLFFRADGTVQVAALHALQIVYHLLNVCLTYLLCRKLGVSWAKAVAVAALFGLYPFSYQAVAWAIPQHPMVTVLQSAAWICYINARPLTGVVPSRPWRWHGVSLLLFVLALAIQESSVVVAVIPLLYELLVRQQRPPLGRRFFGWLYEQRWALAYGVAALVYLLVWVMVPRKAGIAELFFDGRNVAYLMQGITFPIWGRPQGYAPELALTGWVVPVSVLVLLAVMVLASWRQRLPLALFALVWSLFGLLPAFMGLDFDYVSLAPRLLYTSAFAICLLWSCALWPRPTEPTAVRWLSILLVGLMLLQSWWLVRQFDQLWRAGTAHLNEALVALDEAGDGRYLFLNFPDRYAPKRPPYPVGYWGLTLAPIVVEFSDYQQYLSGRPSVQLSRAMPWIDMADRDHSPYYVDMRGVIIEPPVLATLTTDVDGVYMTNYLPDGRFALQRAGAQLGTAVGCELAYFTENICLHQATLQPLEQVPGQCRLQSVWSVRDRVDPHVTILVHMGLEGQAPLAQADGDAWRGTLPFAHWPLQTLLLDERRLPCPKEAAHVVQVGVYNWVDGGRLPGFEATGEQRPLAYDAWQVDWRAMETSK